MSDQENANAAPTTALDDKNRRIISAALRIVVELPPVGKVIKNKWGFMREVCDLCGTELRQQYRRSHFARVHGYDNRAAAIDAILAWNKATVEQAMITYQSELLKDYEADVANRVKATVIEELETILNCWEYPALAPHFLTDRIAALKNEQDRNNGGK